MSRERWMALAFALGSACFLIGPFPGYVQLVGAAADAITFFAGSILFTTGGAVQTWLAVDGRRTDGIGRAAWWTAVVQSAGTLCFNVSTFAAIHTVLSDPRYDRLVWRPDAFGSVCFLVSGVIAYQAFPPRLAAAPGAPGWWEPAVNLLGCVFFGISAVAGCVVVSTTSMIDQAAVNWNTAAGAACFLACAVATLRTGRTHKSPRLRRRIAQEQEARIATPTRSAQPESNSRPTGQPDRPPRPSALQGRRAAQIIAGCTPTTPSGGTTCSLPRRAPRPHSPGCCSSRSRSTFARSSRFRSSRHVPPRRSARSSSLWRCRSSRSYRARAARRWVSSFLAVATPLWVITTWGHLRLGRSEHQSFWQHTSDAALAQLAVLPIVCAGISMVAGVGGGLYSLAVPALIFVFITAAVKGWVLLVEVVR